MAEGWVIRDEEEERGERREGKEEEHGVEESSFYALLSLVK